MQFEFATATRIVFGSGTLAQAATAARAFGGRVLLVTGSSIDRAQELVKQLTAQQLELTHYCVSGEPTIETVTCGVRQARVNHCDVVVGLGGGSVLDAGKAIAALVTNEGEPLDYLEVIGRGRALANRPAPFVAIPTTAGTGAEVTRNAVLGSPEHQVKVSLRSPLMLPRLAIVDPQLTLELPRDVTASTGLDALTQLIEPFVSHKANPLTDGFCREGIPRVARSLAEACDHPGNLAAREDMALASLCGGLALANAKLGAVHGIAGPLGGMFPAPHGAACAALLPHVMAVNVQALLTREPNNAALPRFDEVARLLTGAAGATAADGVAFVQELCVATGIPGLRTYGMTRDAFAELIEKSTRASSMQGNPIKLQRDELEEILMRAL
jgi:alcohol dehydrogenase class IV